MIAKLDVMGNTLPLEMTETGGASAILCMQ
jgi:hypothetical protein